MITTALKTALFFAQPLGLIWALLGGWLLLRVWKRDWLWSQLAMPAAAWLLMTLITCTPFSSVLMDQLEDKIPPVELDTLPTADAIICLGGGVAPSFAEPVGFHLMIAADRSATALALAARKKAPMIILGGGGYEKDGEIFSEADALRDGFAKHGPLGVEYHSLGACSDTHDEAVKVAELAKQRGLKRLFLVTSASHMPRSVATFEKAGVDVIPVPCNYLSSLNQVTDLQWIHLPSSQGFEIFNFWLHELVGGWVYRWRGWI